MTKFIALAIPKFTCITLAIKKPFLLLVPVALVPVVSLAGVSEILIWLFAIDLVSGLIADIALML